MANFFAKLCLALVLACSFLVAGAGGAAAQEKCESPVAQLEAELKNPHVASTIKKVERLDAEKAKHWLDTAGMGVQRNEDAMILVFMGDEVAFFGVSAGCVVGSGSVLLEQYRALFDGTPT